MAEAALLERATQFTVFSLQKISLLYLSTTIFCNDQELIGLITKCVYKKGLNGLLALKNGKDYKIIKAKAKKLFSKIDETGEFKHMILELLWPVTYRIIRWKSVYAPTIDDQFLQYFYWTYQGRIDNKRTAKYIIKNKKIPISKRFMLACSLCLSEEIHELWNNMSIADKQDLAKTDWTKNNDLLLYWLSKFVRKQDNVFGEYFNKALLCAVDIGSLEAIKYFFSIIPESTKSDKAVFCSNLIVAKLRIYAFLEEEESDMGYFILLQMTETHQKTFFNSYLWVVLFLLLYSPGQKEFIGVLKDKLDTTSKENIKNVLLLIIYKLCLNVFKDYDYGQLFVSVWEMLEDSYKEYLLESLILESCFCLLIWNYFRFLLAKKPPKKTKKPSASAKLISFNLEKWELLHFFIEKEIVTTESLTNHRPRVLKLLHTRKSNKAAWRRLMKFVRDNRTG